jgi:hypothetical protein
MTTIINFDDLKSEPPVILVIEGVRHPMKNADVETFIENMSALEKLGMAATAKDEIDVIVGIIARAFPTLTDAQIRKWELDQIKKISDIARGIGGEIVSTDEAKIDEANASGNAPTES